MWDRIKSEPNLVAFVVQAGIGLLAAFGFAFTGEQTAAIMTFTSAVLALLVRSGVTPNHVVAEKVEVALNTPAPPKTDGSPMDQLKPPGPSQNDQEPKP